MGNQGVHEMDMVLTPLSALGSAPRGRHNSGMTDRNRTKDDPSPYALAWGLDPRVAMLNHGSFGACPRAVLEAQQRLRRQMEREPARFFLREMQPLLDASRRALAGLLGVEARNLAFVRNATSGVNGVLRSLCFSPGDELLLTDHAYNACRNVVHFVAGRAGAKVVTAAVPFPVESADRVVEAIIARVSERTRLAMLDHVTSPTAVIFPIERLVQQLDRLGVDTLVDGAHAPGMVPLEIERLGAAYYTGNCHKWLCGPKGAGFLYVRPDRQADLQPAVISHGFNTDWPERARLHVDFDWTGTDDPTPWLCVGEAIAFVGSLTGGGLEGLIRRNRQLVLEGRRIVCEALRLALPCPDEMIGSMAAMSLPDAGAHRGPPHVIDPLQTRLLEEFGIEVPIFPWPAPPRRLLRISAQAYNSPDQYQRLADALSRFAEAGLKPG